MWSKIKIVHGAPERKDVGGPLRLLASCKNPMSKVTTWVAYAEQGKKIWVRKQRTRLKQQCKRPLTVIRLIASTLTDGISAESCTPGSWKFSIKKQYLVEETSYPKIYNNTLVENIPQKNI